MAYSRYDELTDAVRGGLDVGAQPGQWRTVGGQSGVNRQEWTSAGREDGIPVRDEGDHHLLLSDAPAPAISHPSNGSRVGANVVLWGTGAPGGRIVILDGPDELATADVDDTGVWGVSLHRMTPGSHRLQARSLAGTVERSVVSMPVQIQVEGEPVPVPAAGEPMPEARTSRVSWPLVAAAIVLAGVTAVATLLIRADVHIASTPTAAGHSRSVPSPAPSALPTTAPARSWNFPVLAGPADQTVLALSNPGAAQAVVTVVLSGSRQSVTLKPQNEAEIELAPRDRGGRIGVTSTAPIVAERVVVRKGKTSISYGLRASKS